MSQSDDSELLRLVRDPSRRELGFRRLVEVYSERLYHHIRRMVIDHQDADDVLQNTFVRAWQGLDKFRAEAGLYTWLYRIATNEALSHLKKKRRRFFLPIHDVTGELSRSLASDSAFDGDAAQQKFFQAFVRLPDKQRAVFALKYFEEMKYDAISEVLNTSVGALKASYHHATQKIRQFLEAED